MMRLVRFYRRSLLSRLVALYALLFLVAAWFTLAGELHQIGIVGFELLVALRAIPIGALVLLWLETFYRGSQGVNVIEVSE